MTNLKRRYFGVVLVTAAMVGAMLAPEAWGACNSPASVIYTMDVRVGDVQSFYCAGEDVSIPVIVATIGDPAFTGTQPVRLMWGLGGAVSGSINIDFGVPYTITIPSSALTPGSQELRIVARNIPDDYFPPDSLPCIALTVVRFTVLKVDLLHDIFADLQTLDDWPQNGSQLRSPRFIFGKEDNIFIRVTGPSGLGNSYFKAKVVSQSDATGIDLDLREISSGVYMNSDADNELLRLADASAEGSPADTIKVVEEEVLTFTLSAGGNPVGCDTDVMVDRGEYAAAGDANWPTDTQKFKAEMVNSRVNWSEAGYNDAFGPTTLAAFRTFIKAAGAGTASHGESDMLYYTAHGDYDGTLYAHPPLPSSAIFDGYGIANGSDWNNDVEWFYSDACSTLHNASQVGFLSGRINDGYLGWTAALFGNPRPAHMVLGHWAPVNDQWSWKGWGNSQAICDDFFDHAADSSPDTIINAWLHANTDFFADQECVVIAHATNVADQLKMVTRDSASTAMKYYWYDPTGVGGTWHDTDFTKSFPSHVAPSVEIPDVSPLVARRQLAPIAFLERANSTKYRRLHRIRHGAVSALLKPSQSNVIDDAASAWSFLKSELAITQELPGISQAAVGTFSEGEFTWGDTQFKGPARIIARLYKWTHSIDGAPVYGDEVALLVIEGHPAKVRACWHQEMPSSVSGVRAVSPKTLVTALDKIMKGASPPFEKITRVGMGYYTFQDAGKRAKQAVPAWMFQVENATRKRTIYFDAVSGAHIDSRRDMTSAVEVEREQGYR